MLLAPAIPVSAEPRLDFRLVTDFPALEGLASGWEELLSQSASAEPMLSPAWLLTWWRIYGEATGRALRVGLFHEGDRLVGLALLHARRAWHRRLIPLRRLEFLGADVDEKDGVCSEYLNVVARSGYEASVADAFADAVSQGRFGRWDELLLPALDGSGALTDLLAEAFRRRRYFVDVTQTSSAPYLALPATWEEYLHAVPSRKRHFLQKNLREFEQWAGAACFHEVRTFAELEKGQRLLKELHQHRWEKDAEPGAFSSPRFCAFHDAFMRQLLERGQLELFWLEVRGQPIAAHYNFLANGKTYFYQSGRRTDVPPKVSPGVIIMIRAIQNAIGRGAREFDFLAGPSQFKLQFTQTTRPLVQLRVARRGVAETLRRVVERGVGAARVLRSLWKR